MIRLSYHIRATGARRAASPGGGLAHNRTGPCVAVIMVFSTIIGLVTGFYPAYRASRLNPLDALRYK
jgi:hypothetical protein